MLAHECPPSMGMVLRISSTPDVGGDAAVRPLNCNSSLKIMWHVKVCLPFAPSGLLRWPKLLTMDWHVSSDVKIDSGQRDKNCVYMDPIGIVNKELVHRQ